MTLTTTTRTHDETSNTRGLMGSLKRFLTATFLCHAAALQVLAAAPPLVLDLYPGDAPALVSGGRTETLENERNKNVSKPQMKVWFPAKGKGNGTALIICAGGAYVHLAMGPHVENVVDLLTGKGITVIGLKYRTKYGANDVVADALADGKRAVRLTRSLAREWGLDARRVGVQGYSAGANLCLNLAVHFDPGDPAAADPIERLSSRPDFVALMCPWPNGKSIGEFPLRKDSPPTFIAHARDDRTAPFAFAEAINHKLTALGVPHQLFAVDTGGHSAFHYPDANNSGNGWPDALLPWLRSIGMLK